MKVATGMLVAAGLFLAGVLTSVAGNDGSATTPVRVELGGATGTTAPPATVAPDTAATTPTSPPASPPVTVAEVPEVVEHPVDYGQLEDYDNSGPGGGGGDNSGPGGGGSSGSG